MLVIANPQTVNSLNYKDVNRKLLFEKERWTHWLLSFSFIRNNLHILCKRRAKGLQVRSTSRKHSKFLNNLGVLDGIRVLAALMVSFSMAFFCSYYHVIQFPDDAKVIYN